MSDNSPEMPTAASLAAGAAVGVGLAFVISLVARLTLPSLLAPRKASDSTSAQVPPTPEPKPPVAPAAPALTPPPKPSTVTKSGFSTPTVSAPDLYFVRAFNQVCDDTGACDWVPFSESWGSAVSDVEYPAASAANDTSPLPTTYSDGSPRFNRAGKKDDPLLHGNWGFAVLWHWDGSTWAVVRTAIRQRGTLWIRSLRCLWEHHSSLPPR